MKKTLSLMCIIALVTLALTSCGVQMEDLVGTWHSSYSYNGDRVSNNFYIEEDGSYGSVTHKNGVLSSTEKGTVEIEGKNVYLCKEGTTIKTVFEYKDGILENGGHTYTKTE